MTAISGPAPSGQMGGPGTSSQGSFGSSPYNIGQANGTAFVSGSMLPPGSIAQNGGYSAAQNSVYSPALGSAGSGGHIIGEAVLSAGMSMGSNAAVSHQLGISQMGLSGPYGTGPMSGSFGSSSGQFSGGYPGSSAKMAMPGEVMGTVTIPIYNNSPYPVPVTGSSQAGQQQYGDQARFHQGFMVCPADAYMKFCHLTITATMSAPCTSCAMSPALLCAADWRSCAPLARGLEGPKPPEGL